MKTSALYALASLTSVFVMCASVVAAGPKPSIIQTACLKCHGGASVNGDVDFTQRLTLEQRLDAVAKAARGEMPKNGPKLTPAQFSQLKIELGINNSGASSAQNAAPNASPLANRPASNSRSLKGTAPGAPLSSAAAAGFNRAANRSNSAPAQARISVVSATSSDAFDENVPSARVRVVPPGSANKKPVATARVAVVSLADTSPAPVVPPKPVVKPKVAVVTQTSSEDLTKSLDKLDASKESKLPEAIKGLVGDWMAVSRQGDGELSTVELQLDDHGWAKLTIPGADGKPSTTTRKVEFKDNQLDLTSKSGTVSLGKLVSSDSRQMVLERESGLVTFVRP